MTGPPRRADPAAAACGFGACGVSPARPYPEGLRCAGHTPAARAGNPEPDTARYCLAICYCGGCGQGPAPLAPVTKTIIDLRHEASGKRRVANLADYRDAQASIRR